MHNWVIRATSLGGRMRLFTSKFFIVGLFFFGNLNNASADCTDGVCKLDTVSTATRAPNAGVAAANANVGTAQALQKAKTLSDQASDLDFKAQQLESEAACNTDQSAAEKQRDDAQKKREEAKKLRQEAEREIAQAKTNADSAAKNLAQQKALDGECDSNSGGSNNQGQGKSPMMPPPQQQKPPEKKGNKDEVKLQAQPSMMPQPNAFKGLDPAQELAKESKPPSAIPDWAAQLSRPFQGEKAK